MDLIITYVAAKPFNNNHIFIKELNRSVTKIGPRKYKIITVPKVHSNRNTPAFHDQQLLIIVRLSANLGNELILQL